MALPSIASDALDTSGDDLAIGAPEGPPPWSPAARIVALGALIVAMATTLPFTVDTRFQARKFDGSAAELARKRPDLAYANPDLVYEFGHDTYTFRESTRAARALWLWPAVLAVGAIGMLWERAALTSARRRRRTVARSGAIARLACLAAVGGAAIAVTYLSPATIWKPGLGAMISCGAAALLIGCAALEVAQHQQRGWVRAD